MFVKAIIIIFMLTILYSLGSSFYFMSKDKGEGDRALKRLMWRVGLSIFLLLLLYIMFLLVSCQAYNVGFRATQMVQDKTQSAGNGMSFSRAATPYWDIWAAPFGRAVKRSFAALRLWARTRPLPARRALRPTTSRLAEPYIIDLT